MPALHMQILMNEFLVSISSNYFQKVRPHGTNSPGSIDGDHPQNQDESVFNLYLKIQNKNYSLKSQIVKTNHNVNNIYAYLLCYTAMNTR